MTQLEILKQKGFTKKQINNFYQKKELLSKMNVRYTIEHFENEYRKVNL